MNVKIITLQEEFGILLQVPPATANAKLISFWIVGRIDSGGKTFACILDKDLSNELLETVFGIGMKS